jgi:MarR family 2-MHQ and catechol resistance regulon transcriptional repressor
VTARRVQLRDAVLEELLAHTPQSVMRAMRRRQGGAISLVHLHVLHVMEHEGTQSMRSLAEAIDASQASATGIVDRMEQRGLVRRDRDDSDRRIVRVSITDEGRAVLSGFATERREALGSLLDELSAAELAALLRGVKALRLARERRMAQPEGDRATPPPHA